MGRIQSNVGLITGIDIQKTVDQLIAVSAQPRDRLENRVKGFQGQQVAVNELTALVIGIQLQTDRIGNASNLSTTTATSSKTDVLTAVNSGNPAPGIYSIQTLQTAQTATASSNSFTSATDTLQSGDFVVRTGGFVDSSSSIDELRGGLGIARGKIQITDRSGVSRQIDLRFASNTDDVLKAINSTEGLRVNAKAVGDRIVLSDLSGQTTTNLLVEDVDGGKTAADLGLSGINVAANTATGEDISFLGNSTRISSLRDGRGLSFITGNDFSVTLRDGSTLNVDSNPVRIPTTVGQLVANINAANSSKLEARISADGNGLELIDKTTGSGSFSASGHLADQLGFTGADGSTGTISGVRIQSTLNGPLLSSLKGGTGIGTPGSISITNRSGVTTAVDLSGSSSLRDVLDRINSSNAGVTASLNRSRTGLVLQDVTGSTLNNLVISDSDANNTATKLGIAVNEARNSIDSNSLAFQFVSDGTELSKLNQGRGIRGGSFTITNSAGLTKTVNVSANTKTVGDLIRTINDNAIDVQARFNDAGDGFIITDTSSGSGTLSIADDQSGFTASDLGLRGTAASLESPPRKVLESSQTFKLSLAGTETLTEVVEKINKGNGPLTASILTSGASNVRLLFTSRASGEVGRIFADGSSVGINVNTSGTGRDALVAVGSTPESGGTLVRSSNNTVQNAIEGLTLTVKAVSTTPADVTVSSSNSTIERNIQLFVDQFNKVRDKIEKETAFDLSTRSTGQLFGNPEVIRVEQTLARLITQRSFRSGRVQTLEQLGVGLDDKGKLSFDKDKFSKILQSNPDDVKSFLTAEKTGLGARAKITLDTLVGEKNSVLVNRSQSLQRTIDLSNNRITALNVRLDRERERLLKQFYDMETNISRIRNNGSGLNQLNSLTTTTA
jgi:flagellar hook-associated protein 2